MESLPADTVILSAELPYRPVVDYHNTAPIVIYSVGAVAHVWKIEISTDGMLDIYVSEEVTDLCPKMCDTTLIYITED